MGKDIGTQVEVPGTRGKGILRYHGSIHGKNGIFAGIELLGPIALTRGKNCGDVEGFKYFEVQQPMTGLFIPFERLKAVNPNIECTRDMIDEISDNYNNDALNDDVQPLQDSSFEDYDNGNLEIVYSPTPTIGNPHHSNQVGPGLGNGNRPMRPYSADISKTRLNAQSPVLSAGINNRRNTQFDTRSRTSSMSSFTRSPVLNTTYRSVSYNNTDKYNSNLKRYSNGSTGNMFLEQELNELRLKHEKSEREMMEKMSILNELKDTVQELQPVLKQYETELDERDRKIAKIRNEFESAREDWRQNLDIMVSTYESNENFYESKIRELQKKVNEKSNDKHDELNEIKQKYDDLITSKTEVETSLNIQIKDLESKLAIDTSKELNKKIIEQQKEIDQLSNQLVEIHKFPADGPNTDGSRDRIFQLEAEVESMSHLKKRVEELEAENFDLKTEIERSHSFEKLEDKNTELNKLKDIISNLEESAANKDKEITELEDSLDVKVKELSNVSVSSVPADGDSKAKELEEDMFFKDQEIKALQQQLDKMGETIANQKTHMKAMDSKKSSTVDTSEKDDKIKQLEQEIEQLNDKLNSQIEVSNAQLDTQSKSQKESSDTRMEAQLNEKDNIIKELERKLRESLVHELDSMNITDTAAINEMNYKRDIEQLELELHARPTIEELAELQDKIDEMVRVHNNEVFFKQEEMQRIMDENSKLHTRLERALEGSIVTRISDNTSHENMSINSLPIYKPEADVDPSSGKDNWCGLCERDGHSSLNCPYENDIF